MVFTTTAPTSNSFQTNLSKNFFQRAKFKTLSNSFQKTCPKTSNRVRGVINYFNTVIEKHLSPKQGSPSGRSGPGVWAIEKAVFTRKILDSKHRVVFVKNHESFKT